MAGSVLVWTVTSQREGPEFELNQDLFCVEFVCSPRVITDFPQVLWLPFTIMHGA